MSSSDPSDDASQRLNATPLVCVVAAAGRSRRFGAADKRHARLADGRRLLVTSLAAAAELTPRRLVVLGPGERLADWELAPSANLELLSLERPSDALGDSLAAAFRWLLQQHRQDGPELTAAAVWLADMAWVSAPTCRLLAASASADRLVRPRFHGQPGHPVIIGRDFWPEMTQLHGQDGARALLHRHRQALLEIDVDDPGVVRDLDTPQAPR
ncbi:nucleotidyltransferase family protein [Halomonas litopenaei]|uniref:nucleotidyltransferase family protein n=1 Tax=Halomonas litopenaei TaxID=2109328 RepID=UPI003FA05EF8